MKKVYQIIAFVCLALAVSSCQSIKNVPYFQNVDLADLTASRHLYDEKIMPKDKLTIYVNTTDPEASKPFNLYSSNYAMGGGGGSNYTLPYLVDNEGNINFPVLGKLHVQGLTRNECQDMIAAKLKNYLAETENPIVTINFSSFHVTVLGEVGHVGVISIPDERVNILEALAMAGDITIYGKRDNVLLIREDEHGEKTVHRLNITQAEIMNSPYFYLQQNDIVYVEPMEVKARNTLLNANLGIWYTTVGLVSSISSVVAMVLLYLKK